MFIYSLDFLKPIPTQNHKKTKTKNIKKVEKLKPFLISKSTPYDNSKQKTENQNKK